MVQKLSALDTLPEDPGSVPSTLVGDFGPAWQGEHGSGPVFHFLCLAFLMPATKVCSLI